MHYRLIEKKRESCSQTYGERKESSIICVPEVAGEGCTLLF